MGKAVRQLSFKDRHVEILEQTVLSRFDLMTDFVDRFVFEDMTTQYPLCMFLNQDEFTKLYGAVLTGADLTYPEQSHDIEYLFLQLVQSPMAELCAAIGWCIENDEALGIILAQWLNDNGFGGGGQNPPGPISPEELELNRLPEGWTCDNDHAFGMSLAIVNAIHEATTEVLEAIEILTNPLEIGAELADNIPGVGVLASAADLANWIQNTVEENYELAWSSVVRDELACRLFCEFNISCDLNYDQIFDIYLNMSEETPPAPTDLESWIIWLMAIPFGDDQQIVATVSLLGLLAMKYGGKFGKFILGIRSLQLVMALAADETESDWNILCDDNCVAWCAPYDFTVDDGGWVHADGHQGGGVWTAAGWGYEDIITTPGERRRTVRIEKTFTNAGVESILVNLDFDIDEPNFSTNVAAVTVMTYDSAARTDVISYLRDDAPQGIPQIFEWTDDALDMDRIVIFFRTSRDTSAPYVFGGTILVKSVTICGAGDKPPELP